MFRLLMVFAMSLPAAMAICAPLPVGLVNASFDQGFSERGIPDGWTLYGGAGPDRTLGPEKPGAPGALLLDDRDAAAEIGVYQNAPAEGGVAYRATAMVRAVEGRSSAGANLQMRFLPGDKYVQAALNATDPEVARPVSVTMVAPEGTTSVRLYLYTHAAPTPAVVIDEVTLVSGAEAPAGPAPIPDPVPPVYETLKDLHLETPVARGGQSSCAIIVPETGEYAAAARAVQDAVRELTGASLPVLSDAAPEAAFPLRGHAILFGNRSTNRAISDLYDRFYCLTDLKYPGDGGYELRTVHNPSGNGMNAVIVGGSNAAGVNAAAEALVARLKAAHQGGGDLSLGWTLDVRLPEGTQIPDDIKAAPIWEASRGYGNTGYFGWNSISKRMALYAMTGDPFHAREVVRLSFPDAQALVEIDRLDQELIENKEDPLAGPYHYGGHFMVLLWDLIEESPVFSDAERLKITNAFSRQLRHRVSEGIYSRTEPPACVGDRHGDWAAVSLYCLGRYFQKDYPGPIWDRCIEAARQYFSPLERHDWLAANNDHLFWYNTYYEPILSYMLLSGDRRGLESGQLQKALRTQDVLYTGLTPDPYLNTASLAWLTKTAYLTSDGRWLFYLNRTGLDTDVFRLGQSFWPGPELAPREPDELLNRWTIQTMPQPMWANRHSGIPLEQSFLWGSFRTALDASGDLIMLDGFNGGGRNPYHTFALLEHRLGGLRTFTGYHNQVLTSADGMVEPVVAMDCALLHAGVMGDVALAVTQTPRTPYCTWTRGIVQKTGQWALFIDDLAFRTDTENMEVRTSWEPVGGVWSAQDGALRFKGGGKRELPSGWLDFPALRSEYRSLPPGTEGTSRLDSIDIVLLKAKQLGHWLEVDFELAEPVTGTLFADLLNYQDRGHVSLSLDGEVRVADYNHFAPGVQDARVPLGRFSLAAGKHTVRVEVTGAEPRSSGLYVGFKGLRIRPDGAPDVSEAMTCELHPSWTGQVIPGGVTEMVWRGPVREGERRTACYLLGMAGDDREIDCIQVDERTCALALPEPALVEVAAGGLTDGFTLLSTEGLIGRTIMGKAANGLLESDAPVDVNWDFATGKLSVEAAQPVTLSLATAPDSTLRTVALDAGSHDLPGVVPAADALKSVLEGLQSALDAARASGKPNWMRDAAPPSDLAALDVVTADLPEPVADIEPIPAPAGPLLAVASGKSVNLLAPEGTTVRTMDAGAKVRVLRWWAEHSLLLAGCENEQVIAFTLDGERKWEFTSVMDQAVYEAAKQYWFKSAHPGIYGLHTGVFDAEKSRAFVGSACTLEILDENGQLVKRLPIFWGPGWRFSMVPREDGTRDLLIARWPNDGEHVAVVNSGTLSQTGTGFSSIPAGQTFVGGWTAQNRPRTVVTDTNADGRLEVVSAINGVWNRVVMWDAGGKPLYCAHIGPGEKAPAGMLPDLDLFDLDGDGQMETAAATGSGLVLVLDSRLERRWAKRTPTPPVAVRCLAGPRGPVVLAGCRDGSLAQFSAVGELTATAAVKGQPVEMVVLETPDGPLVALGTNVGQVAFVRPAE